MTTHDHRRPRAADAPTTTTKAPIRGPSAFWRVSTILALVLAAGAAPAEAGEYVHRFRMTTIPASTPPVTPPVADEPSRPVPMLALTVATTYRTSRPLGVILAELADTPSRTISFDAFDGQRSSLLSWQPSDSPQTVGDYLAAIIGSYGAGSVASLDSAGHVTLRVGNRGANVVLTSSKGIALGAFDFRQVSP